MCNYNSNNIEIELRNTLTILKNGGVILYPTDTIWGIGCDSTNEKAVEKIYNIKKRIKNKPLISLVCNIEMINRFTNSDQLRIELTQNPTTIIYQNVTGLTKSLITEEKTSALRITNDTFCNALISQFGLPIVSTSANISNEKIPKKFSEISREIKENVDYIVNLRHDEIMKTPSTIILINKDRSITKIR